MYEQLFNLMLEGLSGASKAYRPLYRKFTNFQKRSFEAMRNKQSLPKRNPELSSKLYKLKNIIPTKELREIDRMSNRYSMVNAKRVVRRVDPRTVK